MLRDGIFPPGGSDLLGEIHKIHPYEDKSFTPPLSVRKAVAGWDSSSIYEIYETNSLRASSGSKAKNMRNVVFAVCWVLISALFIGYTWTLSSFPHETVRMCKNHANENQKHISSTTAISCWYLVNGSSHPFFKYVGYVVLYVGEINPNLRCRYDHFHHTPFCFTLGQSDNCCFMAGQPTLP